MLQVESAYYLEISLVVLAQLVQLTVQLDLFLRQHPRDVGLLAFAFRRERSKFVQEHVEIVVLVLETRQLRLEPLTAHEDLMNQLIDGVRRARLGTLRLFLVL